MKLENEFDMSVEILKDRIKNIKNEMYIAILGFCMFGFLFLGFTFVGAFLSDTFTSTIVVISLNMLLVLELFLCALLIYSKMSYYDRINMIIFLKENLK